VNLQHDVWIRAKASNIRVAFLVRRRLEIEKMKAPVIPALGTGIYHIADVSRYAHIPHTTARSWFKSGILLNADYCSIDDDYSVSFHDLIDAMIAHQFRKYGVAMKTVRLAYQMLQTQLNTFHPFCHRDLYTNGKRILIREAKNIKAAIFRDAINNQQFFDEMRSHLTKVSYSDSTLLAKWLNPWPGVVINPSVAMGEPVLSGTGVTTFVVRNAYNANRKNADLVASLYGLSVQQVEFAVGFEKEIRPAA